MGTGDVAVTVQAVDNDGAFVTADFQVLIENVLGVVSESLSDQINVFPNPSRSTVWIRGEKLTSLKRMLMYDTDGNVTLIAIGKDSKQMEVDISKLSPGTYFIVMELSEGVAGKKIVKQ